MNLMDSHKVKNGGADITQIGFQAAQKILSQRTITTISRGYAVLQIEQGLHVFFSEGLLRSSFR